MRFIDDLGREHRLVDRVAGSLVRFADEALRGATTCGDVADFVCFLRVFVGGFHHEREEQVLFPALVEHVEVPADRGPLVVMAAEHRQAAAMVDELEAAAESPDDAAAAARRLAHHLWEHVDKEDSVLLPEADRRLVRGGISQLESRAPTAAEEAARDLGERLTQKFPPRDDPDAVRGDGCIACSAFAETCGGIEKEWWNSWEWQHHRSLDEG
jgi:hemerythrin-like domain-containing protein